MWAVKSERCVYYLLGITSFGPTQCGEKVLVQIYNTITKISVFKKFCFIRFADLEFIQIFTLTWIGLKKMCGQN